MHALKIVHNDLKLVWEHKIIGVTPQFGRTFLELEIEFNFPWD